MADTNKTKSWINSWRNREGYFDTPSTYAGLTDAIPNPVYTGLYNDAFDGRSQISSAETVGDYSGDPGVDRTSDAAIGTVADAGKAAAIRAAQRGFLDSTVGTGLTASGMADAAIRGFDPVGFAQSGMSGMLNSAMGLSPNSMPSRAISWGSTLAGLLTGNPAIGIFGGLVAPAIGEKIGQMTESRTDESRKSMIDNFSSGVLDTARISRDIADFANMTPAYSQAYEGVDMGLNANDMARNSNIDASRRVVNSEQDVASQRAAWGDMARVGLGNVADTPTTGQFAMSPQSVFSGLSYSPSVQDYAGYVNQSQFSDMSPIGRTVESMLSFRDQRNPFDSYRNPNSVGNPAAFAKAAAFHGIDISGYSPSALAAAADAFNGFTAGSHVNLGDISGHVNALAAESALSKAQAAAAAVADGASGSGGSGGGMLGQYGGGSARDAGQSAGGMNGTGGGMSDGGD